MTASLMYILWYTLSVSLLAVVAISDCYFVFNIPFPPPVELRAFLNQTHSFDNTHTLTHTVCVFSADQAIAISSSQQKKTLLKMIEDVFILQVFSDPWGTSCKFLSPLDSVCLASLNSNDAYYLP